MESIEEGSDSFNTAMLAAEKKEGIDDFLKSPPMLDNTWVKHFFSSIKKYCNWVLDVTKDQAYKITSGSKPYNCEFTFSTVNIIVMCSLVVAFFDVCKYAFFGKSVDFPLSVVLL